MIPDGETTIFATIGDPIAQARAPALMTRQFEVLGLNAVWLAIDTTPVGLDGALAMLGVWRNLGGFTVTVPHKTILPARADIVSTRALASGAANLVRRNPDGRLEADMVDGLGFVRALQAAGHAIAGRRAWIVGAGGAGSAIAASLAEEGIGELFVTDPHPTRVQTLIDRLGAYYPSVKVIQAAGPPPDLALAINATPLGLKAGDPLSFDPAQVNRGAVVCDVIMKPAITPLLERALALGMAVQPGKPMLDHQISAYLAYFGIPHDPEAVLAWGKEQP